MKAPLASLLVLLFCAPSLAQLSQEEALTLLGKAGIATMTPLKAEICNWDSGGMTWDILRQVAAMHFIENDEVGKRLSTTQRLSAMGTVTSPRATEMHRQFVRQALSGKPCDDESVPNNPKTWPQTLETYRQYAQSQIAGALAAPTPAAGASQPK